MLLLKNRLCRCGSKSKPTLNTRAFLISMIKEFKVI